MNQNKEIILGASGLLVGLILGFILSQVFMGKNTSQDLKAEHELLKQAVREQYPEYFDEQFGVSYSGTVEEVRGSSIVVKTALPELLLLASDLSEIREVKIDENTKIIKQTEKSQDDYMRELAEYEAALAEYQNQIKTSGEQLDAGELGFGELLSYPQPTEQREIGIGEIKPGDLATVSVQSNLAPETAGDNETMIATTITVRENTTAEIGAIPAGDLSEPLVP